MKKILIISMLFNIFSYAELSTKNIENMVDKLYKKRIGISLEDISDIEDPFVRMAVEDNVTTVVAMTEIQFSLKGIMNNKAFINDKWYSVGEVVSGYTLKYVGRKGIVLDRDKHIKKIFLRKDRESNIIKVEGN